MATLHRDIIEMKLSKVDSIGVYLQINIDFTDLILSRLSSLHLHLDALIERGSRLYWPACVEQTKAVAHDALIAAMAGPEGFEVMERRCFKRYRAALENEEEVLPKVKLATFAELVHRAGDLAPHLSGSEAPLLTPKEISLLLGFEARYLRPGNHLPNQTWQFALTDLLENMQDIVRIIPRLMTGWPVRNAAPGEFDRIVILATAIDHQIVKLLDRTRSLRHT